MLAKENPNFRKLTADVRIHISHAVTHQSTFDFVPTGDDLAKVWNSWK